jgi:prolyl-tRNA synthetase
MEVVASTALELSDLGIRTKIDAREELTPGYKFNDWELRGVPVRIEVGPRDVRSGDLQVSRRDQGARAGRRSIARGSAAGEILALLKDIHAAMVERAIALREANTRGVGSYDEFKEAVTTGFARAPWAGNSDDEARIKEETKATLRCIPFDQPSSPGRCFFSGRPANQIAIFGRAY